MASAASVDGLARAKSGRRTWTRRALVALLVAIPVLALLNLAGQRASTTVATGPSAELDVHAPSRLRGGLLFQTRYTVVAKKAIENLHLVLSPGWFEGVTLNTIEPAADMEGSRNGRVSLSYGSLDPGQKLVVWMEWQMNPTTVGHRSLTAAVFDGGAKLVDVNRTLTIFP